MNKEVKDLWVATLRGNEYKQGRFMLRDLDDHFDPIGVLCDLAVSAGVLPEPKKYTKPEAHNFFGYTYGGLATRAPKEVCEWAGIGYWTCNTVITMNDNGKSFNDVADWIEQNL